MATETTESNSSKLSFIEWIDENRDMAWDSVRIFLGFALVIKGFGYLFHHHALAAMMASTGVPMAGEGLAEFVALLHITGGLMMTFGILTRVGAAIQIPNLLGAVTFVHLKAGLFTEQQTLEFTVLVLFLLSLITVVGAGRLSIDWAFAEKRMRNRTTEELVHAHAH